jgi:DNA-binding CsgD family transcriptional regulator
VVQAVAGSSPVAHLKPERAARAPRRVAAEVLDRPGRRERAEEIEELAARGFRSDEIAEKLALARSTVNKYRRDPDGDQERARRERYRGRCRGCGRPTRGSDGPGRAPEWCPECAPLRRRSWNDEQTLEAIRDWTQLTGAPPTLYDWSPAHAPASHRGAAGGPRWACTFGSSRQVAANGGGEPTVRRNVVDLSLQRRFPDACFACKAGASVAQRRRTISWAVERTCWAGLTPGRREARPSPRARSAEARRRAARGTRAHSLPARTVRAAPRTSVLVRRTAGRAGHLDRA